MKNSDIFRISAQNMDCGYFFFFFFFHLLSCILPYGFVRRILSGILITLLGKGEPVALLLHVPGL